MDKYLKPVYFHLPGIFEFTNIYERLVKLYMERSEVFKDNLIIGSIYGSPGMHIWNGGRFIQQPKSANEQEHIKNFMADAGIPVRFTFTNCLIEEKHLTDTLCNNTTAQFHTPLNEILCNSPILEEYLREKYPNYSFISSTTKRLLTQEAVERESEKTYKLVVLDYVLNNDFKTLAKLKNKDKLEVLCNAVCYPNCAKRMEHYVNISRAQLENNGGILMRCDTAGYTFDKAMQMPHFVSVDAINKYVKLGYKNFKLEGRTTHPLDLIEILLYYLIKEEYKPEIRTEFHKLIW